MRLLPHIIRVATTLLLMSWLTACAVAPHLVPDNQQYVVTDASASLLAQFAPNFIVDDASQLYNRIGTPAVRSQNHNQPRVYVDSSHPTIYASEQQFCAADHNFTNLIYRVHFSQTPYTHLTGGKNVGLIVIITLNDTQQPLLITTVHSCGCYLAFIPTSNLAKSAYPANWPCAAQIVYGERLPSILALSNFNPAVDKLVLRLKSSTHRITDVQLDTAAELRQHAQVVTAILQPMAALRELKFGEQQLSFFETEGSRKGYVRNSHKPWERLLMSWWAMDWRIGEDKDLGPSDETGVLFYTSLKFWARQESDLWNFTNFLNYWGWKF